MAENGNPTPEVVKASNFRSSTPARKRLCIGPPSSPLLSESSIAQPMLMYVSDNVLMIGISFYHTPQGKGHGSEVTHLTTSAIIKVSPPVKKAGLILPSQGKDREPDGQQTSRRMSWKQRNPRKLRFSSRGSDDGTPGKVSPSPRWGHNVVLCDPDTVILIGGEGINQKPCQDALWKIEIHSDFWFPMDGLCSGTVPQCSLGHTVTFDPETKKVYVYGGMREGRKFSSIYVLDTLDWKWNLLTAGGKVPTLAYHTATIYQRELYVFGGLCPQPGSEYGSCTNSLYIFNPEYKIWYQPIVEGERPLPRYGHSATLLGNRVVIFGGRRSPSPIYFNDVYILDLGYMEFIPLPDTSNKPSPRCFHVSMRVSEHKLLIHGGCSTLGALKDAFILNVDNSSWSSIKFGDTLQPPRAGHTLLNLCACSLTDSDKEKGRSRGQCSVLLIGGSDGSGNFYNDTLKIQLALTE
ncbi:uncharacterized protein LOC128652826 [Bombina bombina]|uniref:uncharacterized protein LOC128652826 n=1 Tax=Bombina bombina TaxID=8345 RepID=UPI00235A6620|nr:uncharacterized protein LOC128652826 [Bombina bombina]